MVFSSVKSVLASNLAIVENETYALNSFTGEQLGKITNFEFSKNRVRFVYLGKEFSFNIQEFNIDTSDGENIEGANFYSQAYHTPAWPSSQLTNVSGTWTIKGSKGAFMAETSASVAVKGVPVIWSKYDVSYMNGTHQ